MTVAELIAKLQELPQDLRVAFADNEQPFSVEHADVVTIGDAFPYPGEAKAWDRTEKIVLLI